MKERLSAFFKNPRKGKNRRIGLILTIVALVEIFAIMVVSTSAWVESISSIKIFTTYDAASNPSGTKGTVESLKKQRVELVSSGSNLNTDIDLLDYFRQSGGYHLCGASSVDGKTMYFPEIKGGDTTNYRIGNVNDKGVNYISFTIKTTTAVDLAFDETTTPSVSFDGTALSGDDLKLIRFSIGDNSGNYRVYSLFSSEFTEDVPAENDGTLQSVTVYPYSDYVAGKNRVCGTVANGFLSFNMWIQDPEGSNSGVYQNKAMTLSNFRLVTVTPFTLKTAYTNDSGTYVLGTQALNPGGTVSIGTGTPGYQAVAYVRLNTTISLKAFASASNGYVFKGWVTSGTSPAGNTSPTVGNTSNPYSYTVTAVNQTFYALFNNVHNIFMRPDYKHKSNDNSTVRFAAFVFGVNSSGQTVGTWYNMSQTSGNDATSWPDYYKCTYRGSATNVIFCYMDKNASANNWNNRWLQTYDLRVPAMPGDYGYIVTCRQYYSATNSIDRNDSNIDEDNGYGTNKVLGYWKHNYVNVQLGTTTNSSTLLANTTYGEYFPSLINTTRTGGYAWWYNDDNTNHRVYVDGQTYQDYDGNGDLIPQYQYNKDVMLSARDNSYYLFKGWYSNAAGTTALPNKTVNGVTYTYQSQDYPITASDNNIYSGTDTVKTDHYYAKFEERPETWQIKYGYTANNWDPVYEASMQLVSGTNNSFRGTMTLTAGQEVWLKIYDLKNNRWYGKNSTEYIDIIKSTIASNVSLSTSGGNIKIKSGFAGTATYTFTFNSSNKQLTITASGTVPTVKLWSGASDNATGGYTTMSRSSTSSNVMTCNMTLTEGQQLYFKVNDQTRNIWYTNRNGGTNTGYYDGYTTSPLVSDSPLGTYSGNNTNMYIHAHAGTYVFNFDYSTKKLTISVSSWSNITITFSYSGQTWVNDSSAVISFYAPNFTETNLSPTTSTSATSRTVSVPSNRGNDSGSIGFNRWNNSSHNTNWNNWNAGSRGFSTTYVVTGGNSGYWS